MKSKTIKIHGNTLSITEAKKRRNQIAKGFAIGMFTEERHREAWKEWQELNDKLKQVNGY